VCLAARARGKSRSDACVSSRLLLLYVTIFKHGAIPLLLRTRFRVGRPPPPVSSSPRATFCHRPPSWNSSSNTPRMTDLWSERWLECYSSESAAAGDDDDDDGGDVKRRWWRQRCWWVISSGAGGGSKHQVAMPSKRWTANSTTTPRPPPSALRPPPHTPRREISHLPSCACRLRCQAWPQTHDRCPLRAEIIINHRQQKQTAAGARRLWRGLGGAGRGWAWRGCAALFRAVLWLALAYHNPCMRARISGPNLPV